MSKKKIALFIIIFLFICFVIYYIATNISISKISDDDYADYTPQEEISDNQSRQTSISLFFLDKQTNTLKSQIKLIDANELLQNPYKLIVQKLLEGPNDENLASVFPDNTRLINATLNGSCVTLDFSEDLLNFNNDNEKFNIINSILNSLSQLTEVNSIKILVNNKQVESLSEEYSIIS